MVEHTDKTQAYTANNIPSIWPGVVISNSPVYSHHTLLVPFRLMSNDDSKSYHIFVPSIFRNIDDFHCILSLKARIIHICCYGHCVYG